MCPDRDSLGGPADQTIKDPPPIHGRKRVLTDQGPGFDYRTGSSTDLASLSETIKPTSSVVFKNVSRGFLNYKQRL